MVMESKIENFIQKIKFWYYIFRPQSHNKELVTSEGSRCQILRIMMMKTK